MASTKNLEELQARIAELEARMERLEQSRGSDSAPAHREDTGHTETGHADTGRAERRRVDEGSLDGGWEDATSTEVQAEAAPTTGDQQETPSPSPDDPYWVLSGLKDRYPDDDFVLYGGTMSLGEGGYRWQYALPTETVLDADFADAAPALTALAHPVRLALLQAVLTGTHATADLAALPGLGTSGQVYHHLNQLASAGWLRSPRRGRWEVPGERTIPLLALIMAATT